MTAPDRTLPRWIERLLGIFAAIVPSGDRADWHREWIAELAWAAHASDHRLIPRLGVALRHALWLRWHQRRLEHLLQDLRHAVRTFARRPAFTLAAALTLALGIGATTAIYSALHAVLWRPLPYPGADSLVMVSSTTVDAPDAVTTGSVSPPDFVDWRSLSLSFADMAAVAEGGFSVTGGDAERVPGARVTGGFFPVLRTPPQLGRALTHGDDIFGGPPVVVLSYGLWQRRFGGVQDIVGRTLTIDGVEHEVVGVMPPNFAYPLAAELWVPLSFSADELATQRGAHYLSVIGRLKASSTLAQARDDMQAVGQRLSADYPRSNERSRVAVHDLHDAIVGDVRPAMQVLFAAVGLLLLVACVNVANLVLGAAMGRERDLALRAVLGAGQGRLVRSQLVESLLLATLGGTGGLLLASSSIRIIAALDGADVPLLGQTSLDASVWLFAGAATVGSAVLSGLVPAWRASRHDVVTVLRSENGRATADQGGTRARGFLVTAEVGLAVALVVGAGLVGRSFLAIVNVPLGFDAAGVQTASIAWPEADYPPERRAVFLEALLDRLAARPEIESAGAIFGLPLSGTNYFISAFERDGVLLSQDDRRRLTVQLRIATPGYFESLDIPIRQGRTLTSDDRKGRPPSIVISETAARLIWPGENPIGRTFTLGTRLGLGDVRAGGAVVGVVGDVRNGGPTVEIRPVVYLAHKQFPFDTVTLVAKARSGAVGLPDLMRQDVRALDPNVPLFRERSMAQLESSVVAQPRLYVWLLGLFAAVATLLAAIGVYGVMAQMVNDRTREIGIRLALGAKHHDVVFMVVGQATRLAALGIAAGWAVAFSARHLLGRILFDVGPTDAATYVSVAALVFLVAAAAAWLPARRAARVDAMNALKAD